jgi:O-antigen/teichoic acid export membrane protein
MRNKIFRKYFSGGLYLNLPLAINVILSLIALPIVLKSLLLSDYGKWQFVLALQSWFLVLTATDITFASKKGITQGLNGTFLYAFLKRYKLVVFISIFIVLLSLFFKFTGDVTFLLLLLILAGYLLFGYLFQVSFFEFLIAKKKFKEWSFWQIFLTSLSILASTLAAYLTKNIIYFAFFQLGSIAILAIFLWLYLIKKERLIESYKRGEIDKECIPYGLKLIPINLVSATSSKLSHFIIGPFLGFTNLAVFSIANKLRDKSASVIKSLRPLFYADFAKKDQRELIKIINRNLLKIGFFGFILTIGFIVLGSLYIKLFLPLSFQPAILYFIILAFSLPTGFLATILHTILESHLRYKELAVIGVVPNLSRIVLILIFGYFWQIIGICIALTLTSWLTFYFYYLMTVKKDLAIKILRKYPFLEKLAQIY